MTDMLSTSVESSDAELIAAVRGGDTAAYGLLFDRHRDAALRLARQLMRGPDADDLVSESFVRVLQVLQDGRGPDESFRAYLLTSIRRLHIDRHRSTSRVTTTDDEAQLDRHVEFVDTAAQRFEQGAAADAFASLPERWQLVLWHLDVEGQKPADLAPLLGMSANSVSALAYRAREGLRQAYLQGHLAPSMHASCRKTTGLLGAYVRKGLAKRDHATVEAHLDGCSRCTGLALELAEVNSNLAGLLAPALLGSAAAGYLAAAGATAAGAAAAGASGAAGAAGGSGAKGAATGTAAGGAAGGAATSGVAGAGAASTAVGASTAGATSAGVGTAATTAAAATTTAGVGAGTTATAVAATAVKIAVLPAKAVAAAVAGATTTGAQGVVAAAVVASVATAGTVAVTTDIGGGTEPAVTAPVATATAPVDPGPVAPTATEPTPTPEPTPTTSDVTPTPEVVPAPAVPTDVAPLPTEPTPTPEPEPTPPPEPPPGPTDFAVGTPVVANVPSLLERRITIPVAATTDGRAIDRTLTVTITFDGAVRYRGTDGAWDCGTAVVGERLTTLACTTTVPAGQGAELSTLVRGLAPRGTVTVTAADDPDTTNDTATFASGLWLPL